MGDLPSPRGKGRGANNTFNLLPFFQEDQFSKEYQLQQQQKIDKARGDRASVGKYISQELAQRYDMNRAQLVAKRNAE